MTDGVIQYIDGYAWGISATGQTICLGTELVVKAVIANPKLKSGYPDIDQIIELERSLTGEKGNGDTRITAAPAGDKRPIKASGKRVRPANDIKYRVRHARPVKAGKRLSGSLLRPAQPGVSNK